MENKIKCYCGHTDFCDCVPLKLTAVEWLLEYIERENWSIPNDISDKAKAMEKEQIEDALSKETTESLNELFNIPSDPCTFNPPIEARLKANIDRYEKIKTKENYDMLLGSGTFFRLYYDLSGIWEQDKLKINF